eukprot:COSAG02_NODE_1043_length_15014_cov_8.766007_9_plen_104_part_00
MYSEVLSTYRAGPIEDWVQLKIVRRTDNLGPVRTVFDNVSPSILGQDIATGEDVELVTLADRHRPLTGPIWCDARQRFASLGSDHAPLRARLLLGSCREGADR